MEEEASVNSEDDNQAEDAFAELDEFEDFDFDAAVAESSEENTEESDDSDEFNFDEFDFDAAMEDTEEEVVTAATNITNPEILKAVDDMNKYLLAKHKGIGKIVALPTFIKRVNQVWNAPGAQDDEAGAEYLAKLNTTLTTQELLEKINHAYIEAGGKYATVEDIIDILMKDTNFNGTAFYEVPYDPEKYPQDTREALSGIVANYLDSILSGSASISRFVDSTSQPQIMRITCQLRVHTTDAVESVINDAKEYAAHNFPEGYTLESTGSSDMEVVMTDMIVESQISSLAISLISVFIIIAISFKSGWAGILGAIPLAFAILLNYMIMGFAGINLDLVTSIIASLAVGVGIDYTIHFLSTYKEERSKTDDIEYVTKQTFQKSGHGIITNALAVGFGFLVLCFSKFVVLRYIGVLVALVMFTSSFLAMTIIPGILTLLDPKFIRPKNKE
ncbi:MAG: MMPL family transporter [Treponema sp.]|nr:MMPL family transporter [Treponema sp.]